MKIFINILLSLAVIMAGVYAGQKLLQPSSAAAPAGLDAGAGEHGEATTGSHGGRLLDADDFRLEVMIYERGVPPEFRVYAYGNGDLIEPENVDLTITLKRLGGGTERLVFTPLQDYLVSQASVTEPHSFDVQVDARYDGQTYEWTYAQHEGRTVIPSDQAEKAGIETATAGPATIRQTINLQGRVHYDPGRVRQVRARYPGMVLATTRSVGDRVKKGETLAQVESNDSLQGYAVSAPIDGVVIEQHATAGEAVTDQALYVIANLDRVWVDLAVFREQLDMIAVGQPVHLQSLNGELVQTARLDYLLPATDGRSQATMARVYLDNPDGRWRPGMAVTAGVTVDETEVPLAVRNSALQTFRDFDVVFARFGDTYEVRMLELGRSDATHTEVLGGLDPGTEYVVDNSYLLKADIEKSGAAHAH